jgi:peroxiredoxin
VKRLLRRTLLGIAAALSLAACSDAGVGDPVDDVARNESRYIAGANQLRTIAIDDRRPAPELQGTLLDGGSFDLAEQRGKVVVLNVWGSWCPPCRAEAPTLEQAWRDFASQGVQFVGINTRDGEATALAFERRFDITYPSVVDSSGVKLLAFSGAVSPAAIPSTLVLDRDGRVAAVYSGEVTVAKLRDMITAVLAEPFP